MEMNITQHFCIRIRLTKILSNLLENALKYTNSGFIELGYTVKKQSIVIYLKDTGIGISHGLALAASQNTLSFDCGLATTSLLESDVITPPLEITAGTIAVNRSSPDEKLVAKYLASADRRLWWQNRIERIWESGFGERWQSEQRN